VDHARLIDRGEVGFVFLWHEQDASNCPVPPYAKLEYRERCLQRDRKPKLGAVRKPAYGFDVKAREDLPRAQPERLALLGGESVTYGMLFEGPVPGFLGYGRLAATGPA
jgi:hypothetical protein